MCKSATMKLNWMGKREDLEEEIFEHERDLDVLSRVVIFLIFAQQCWISRKNFSSFQNLSFKLCQKILTIDQTSKPFSTSSRCANKEKFNLSSKQFQTWLTSWIRLGISDEKLTKIYFSSSCSRLVFRSRWESQKQKPNNKPRWKSSTNVKDFCGNLSSRIHFTRGKSKFPGCLSTSTSTLNLK